MEPVRILLASYEGAAYLRPQLDSLLAQTLPGLEIVVSDDGSTDGSAEILAEYAAAHPGRIVHYRSGRRFGNSQGHFLHLLRRFGDSPYLLFCDQDDVWHPDKAEKTVAALRQLCPDPAVPALVHTDLRVVDRDLRELSPSFLRFSALDGSALRLNQLLVQNVVTGCTVALNRSLADLFCSAEDPGTVLMHDWYLALLAAACGKIGFLPEATIDYRQHGRNAVGAKNARSPTYLLHRLRENDIRAAFLHTAAQAASLAERYGAAMPPEALELCRAFAALPDRSKAARLRTCRRCGFYKQGFARRLGQVLFW